MPCVLIVDDVASERLTLASLCHSLGAETASACGPAEASVIVRERRPCAAVIDLVMPGADGLDCLFMVSKLAPRMPVAIVTSADWLLLKAAAELADRYGLEHVVPIPKPVAIPALREFLHDAGLRPEAFATAPHRSSRG